MSPRSLWGGFVALLCRHLFFATRYSVFSVTSRKTHFKSQGFVKSNDAFPSSASLTFLDVLPPWQIQKMLMFRLLSVAEITTIHPHPVDANNLGQRQHTARQPPQLRKLRGQKWGGWGSQGQWKANCCINLANKKNKRNMAANQDKHSNHHVHPTDNLWHRRSDFLLLLRNSNA